MRGRRSNVRRSPAPRRVRVWDTLDQLTTSLGAGASANYSLFPNFTSLASTLGMTAVRTHVRVTPVSAAPVLGDSLQIGVVVGRASDLADPTTAGQITTAQQDLDWAFLNRYTASPTLGEGGSNDIVLDLKSKRKVPELNQVWMISIRNQFAAAAQFRIFARTLYLLP